MIKEPIFKICSTDDIPQILEVYRKSYIEHYTYLWSDNGDNYMKNSFTPERILSEMRVNESRFYIIFDEDIPVGILKINNEKYLDGTKNANYLEIERIYFLKATTGKGLGKSTLKMVEQLALNENKKVIWLKAMKEADVVKFYEKQGFVITDEFDLSYPLVKEQFKRMVIMQLHI